MIEPTGYTALDLVGFTDRGTYAANVNYVKNDLVHHGGNIWRVLIDDTIGITPAEGPNYTVFVGEPINLVERIIAPLEDNPATVAYQTGRQIIYNDHLYEVIQNIGVGDILIAYEDDPTNANIKLASPVETQVLALNASKVNKSDIVNNVTTTAEGKVLDARQGKVLQDGVNTKVNKSDIVNNVTTTAEGKVLDARQGKVLQDGVNTKVNKSDIVNNVTTTAEGKVLDARQGKALQDGKTDTSVIAPVESGTTASRAYAAGAHFIKGGAFCTAKTAIAQGEAFTLNTNYTAGNIGDSVEDLEEKFDYSSVNYTAYTKHANVTINSIHIETRAGIRKVFFDFRCNAVIPYTERVVTNIPPFKHDAQTTIVPYNGSEASTAVYLANGELQLYNCKASRYIFEMIGFVP